MSVACSPPPTHPVGLLLPLLWAFLLAGGGRGRRYGICPTIPVKLCFRSIARPVFGVVGPSLFDTACPAPRSGDAEAFLDDWDGWAECFLDKK